MEMNMVLVSDNVFIISSASNNERGSFFFLGLSTRTNLTPHLVFQTFTSFITRLAFSFLLIFFSS